MSRFVASARPGRPAWPYGAILVLWAVLTAWMAGGAWRLWHAAGRGGVLGSLLSLSVLAQSAGAFYLLGFLAKAAGYLLARKLGKDSGPPDDRRAGDLPRPAVAVLYLTAGDFDPQAVASLLDLRYGGPKRLILHDDGDDDLARAAMREFLTEHDRHAEWEVEVWHRPQRRGGKAGAVNWVLARLEPRWELLLLCDSDSIARVPDALERVVDEFSDPGVAVVQCRNVGVAEPDASPFARRLALAIDVYDALATPQALWGYLPFFGHNAVLRIADLRALGGLTPGFFSDDLDYSVRLALAGRRIVYRRDVEFAERQPPDWAAFRKRSRKWAYGCMQVLRARGRAVLTSRCLPLSSRLGLLEFMGFYPVQALLIAGLVVTQLLLPWWAPASGGPFSAALAGAVVSLGLLSPTLAWAVRARQLRAWPALAWACALVFGGSIFPTARGVVDGLSSGERRWIPTNLSQARRVVPWAGWVEALLGTSLLMTPWWAHSPLIWSPATYFFVGVLMFSPLTFATYREKPRARHDAAPARSQAGRRLQTLHMSALAIALVLVGARGAVASPRASVAGDQILVDGAPLVLRGVHYSPWQPGTGPGQGSYPSADVVERDLRAIGRMGANALLMHSAPRWAVRRAGEHGFVVLYAYHLAWNDTTATAWAGEAKRVIAGVDSLKLEPAVIGWILGNEVPAWVVDQLGAPEVERRLRSLAAGVRAADPGRLLGHGNWPPTKDLDLGSFDLACFNLYPAWPYEVAVRGFGPYLREVLAPLAHGKPLLVTEFGINSLEAGESRQAAVLADCWSEIARSRAAGGVLFEWCDEWWKNYDNPIAGRGFWERSYDPEDAARQDNDPEEHYGIVRADRTAKPAYVAMRAAWEPRHRTRSPVPWAAVALLGVASWWALGGRRIAWPRTRGRQQPLRHLVIALVLAAACSHRAAAQPWAQVYPLAGEVSNDQYGWALACAGDLNSDGAGDFAIGARFHTTGPDTAAGAVYVYGGGSGAPTLLARLEGVSDHEHFGESLAGGRDVDGDSISDLVVGAPLRGSGTGAVEVYRGGALGAGAASVLAGEATDDWFGQSVAVGDLDGDGRAEVIVGAPYNDRAASAAGAVFIYRGASTITGPPWKVLTGLAANDQFGWAVAYLGDFDGDGYGDLAVGARLYGTGFLGAQGRVDLFRGGPAMDTASDGAWFGEAKDDWFGNSVAGPGDVDGAGRPDLLVGAPYNDRGGSAAGAGYLLRGEDPPGTAPRAIYVGETANAQLGWALAGAGDADLDGHADVVVGARMQASGSKLAAGRVYLFRGGPTTDAISDATFDGSLANDWLGNSVDGTCDMAVGAQFPTVVGAPYNDAGATDAGSAYALGPAPGTAAPSPPQVAADGLLTVAPNPARDVVAPRWIGRASEDAVFELVDARGRRVQLGRARREAEGWVAAWSEPAWRLPAGVYVVLFRPSPRGPIAGSRRLTVLR